MEHRKAFLTLLMVCLGFTLFAQTEGKVFVVEALVCDSTGAAIRDVAVYDGNNDLRSITDRDGIAVCPDAEKAAELSGSDMAHWLGLSAASRRNELTSKPMPEIEVTQEMRQEAFDNWETGDDHGLLIFGKAKDQNGKEYFMGKNSWGDSGKYHGIWYVSEAFAKYKTMNIVLHKDALPKAIAKKLGVK